MQVPCPPRRYYFDLIYGTIYRNIRDRSTDRRPLSRWSCSAMGYSCHSVRNRKLYKQARKAYNLYMPREERLSGRPVRRQKKSLRVKGQVCVPARTILRYVNINFPVGTSREIGSTVGSLGRGPTPGQRRKRKGPLSCQSTFSSIEFTFSHFMSRGTMLFSPRSSRKNPNKPACQ